MKMVQVEGVPAAEQAIPGMAYFAGTGPFARKCGECIHRGYKRESVGGHLYSVQGCAEFKRLAGHHGPAIDADNDACKYFAPKERSS